jgi:NADH-quinone oxidoreductase subunit N
LAAVALTAQLLVEPFGQMTAQWQQVLIAIAVLSMLIGSVVALVQTNIKRLMAYSSISNIGFALVGLCAGGQAGASAALLYMTIYLPTTIGLFALILSLRRDGQPLETIHDLGGLAQRHLWLAVFGTVLLFSMAGIPPLAGFWGKWSVFVAAVGAGLTPLVVFGVVCAVLAAGYYLRLIAIMWFSPATAPQDHVPPVVAVTSGVSAALSFPILAIGVGLLGSWIATAAGTSFP